MDDIKIIFSALWIVLLLRYLLGDVIQIYAGDFTEGKIDDKPMTQIILLGIAVFMLIPIVLAFLSLILPSSVNRWANIIVAIFLFLFNLVGLPSNSSIADVVTYLLDIVQQVPILNINKIDCFNFSSKENVSQEILLYK